MTLPQCYIGVDVSKNWIDLFVENTQKLSHITNRQTSLAEWVTGLGEVTVIFEATGRYDHELSIQLDELGIPYVRMNPLRARQFARAAGFLAKTDRLDARILCMMGEALRPEPTMPIRPVRQRLYDLQARREDIVVMIIAEQGRLSIAKDPFICKDLKASIRALTRRRDVLQKQIDAHIEANRELPEQYRQLQSAPGVGPQVACRLMASMPELGHVDRRQIASLAGLAPHARESDLYKGDRAIHGGRSHVRRAIHMPALVAIRWDQHWKTAYLTVRNAGIAAKTAINAIARRLLVRINAMVKTGVSYQV